MEMVKENKNADVLNKNVGQFMKLTHLEKITKLLGDKSYILHEAFKAIKQKDSDITSPLDENIFEMMFEPTFFCNLFSTPNLDRSNRLQFKMDQAVMRHMYHLWRDKNYFDITPALVSKLKDTDFRDIDTFFLRVPYRSFYMSLPDNNGMKVRSDHNTLHNVQSIYVTMNDYSSPTTMVVPRKNMILSDISKQLHMLVCGEGDSIMDDTLMYFNLIFWEGKVSASLERNKELLDMTDMWEEIIEVFNFVTKILLYMNCSNVAIREEVEVNIDKAVKNIKKEHKKRKARKKLSRLSAQKHKIFDVIINPDQNHKGSKNGGGHRKAKELEKVRGHFKVQRHGKGFSESKILWIKPYIRGEGSEHYKDKRTYKVI